MQADCHCYKTKTDCVLAQVEMFVANLRPEWEELSAFKSAMEAEGDVIRCFIMRNARGASKVGPSAPAPPCWQWWLPEAGWLEGGLLRVE